MDERITLYIDEIPAAGRQVAGSLSAELLGLPEDPCIRCESPVRYDLSVAVVSHEFLAHGVLNLDLAAQCSRCSVFFPVTVEDSTYHYDEQIDKATESVDLTDDIREAIILAFPSYPICSLDCKGLCPQCGANKNDGECDCKPPDDTRWAALDGLG